MSAYGYLCHEKRHFRLFLRATEPLTPDNMTTNSTKKEHAPNHTTHKALTITITSGKGGVGKTNITTNLGLALARAGKKVCIFDADISLANINILLGLHPELTLEHLLSGDHSIDEIILDAPENLKIIPAASGINECINLSSFQQNKLLSALEQLEQQFDYLLVDSAAGIGDSVLNFILSSQYTVIVISPEPTSLTDAFSLIKVLQRKDYDQPIYILVNMCDNYAHSMEVFKRFAHAVNKFIKTKVRYLGYIPTDPALIKAVSIQSPVFLSAPNSPASRCISILAGILVKHFIAENTSNRSISQFWSSQLPDQRSPERSQEEPVAKPQDAEHLNQGFVPYSHGRYPSDQAPLKRQLLDSANHYLHKYGDLPDSLIDLVKKSLPDHKDEPQQLTEQKALPANTFYQSTPDASADLNQIEKLVARAANDKAYLSTLLLELQKQYRKLYQSPPGRLDDHSPTSIKTAKDETLNEDQQILLETSSFAAMIDKY